MDGIGAEVSQKIRSAIKAKLMELGAYVDEELPDYIMVMVANKRSQEQMEDDLQLFLGSNTEEFTAWLHQVLQKLQEVTVASLERKRKSSAGDSENESSKKDKRRKSSERKKFKKSEDQPKEKDSKIDSEVINEYLGKKKEQDKVSTSQKLEQSENSKEIKVKSLKDTEPNVNLEKSQKKIDEQPNSVGSGLDKLDKKLICSVETVTSQINKDSKTVCSKLQSDPSVAENKTDSERIETDAGKTEIKKISLVSQSTNCMKDVTFNVPESSKKKDISESGSDMKLNATNKELVGKKATAEVKPSQLQTVSSRTKIILMQSDDDDEDFINIKADAEAEALLDAELPQESLESSNSEAVAVDVSSTVLDSKIESAVSVENENKQSASNFRGLHKSSSPGTKVAGSILDRLGIRKIASLSRDTSKSNSPLLRVADRLGEKVPVSVTDRLGIRKVGSFRSDEIDSKDNSEKLPQSGITSRLANRLGTKITSSSFPSERRNISLVPNAERRNISVAQIAPTTINRPSKISIKETLKSELDKINQKPARRPLSPAKGEIDKEQGPRKRPLLSRVVAMHKEPGDKDTEEEYDPTNPAVGSVASVVRVKPRPKVPAALQANKNLILKAMAEAQKSVSSAPKRIEPAERPNNLYTRNFRDNKGRDKIAITLPNRRVQPNKETPISEKSSDIDRIVIPVKLDASRSISSVNLQQKIVIQVSSEKPVVHETVTTPDESKLKEPDVTESFDDGTIKLLDETPEIEEDEDEEEEEEEEEEEDEEMKDETYDEIQKLISYETQSSWTKEMELESEYANEDMDTSIENQVSLPEVQRSESPQFVVTLDGLDPSIFHARKKTLEESPSLIVSSSSNEPESPTILYEEKERCKAEVSKGKATEKRTTSPVILKKSSIDEIPDSLDAFKQKINERCKYWPACRSGDKCDYLHPTVLCKSFPNCKFGDKCLYIHPNCKFDASCTRRDCPFTHASPRNMSTSSSVSSLTTTRTRPASTTVTQQVCKFFPKCTNSSCRYLHPKPCRYGRYCSRKTECNYLHDEIPSADKLKWICPFKL